MNRIVLIIGFIIVFALNLFSQEVPIMNDSSANQILNELQIIRSIQEESRSKRARAVAERQKRDSMQNRQSEEDISSDYSIMAKIEDNTHQDPITDGWNVYGIAAILISFFSLIVSWYTFYSQRKTEGNTKKLSKDMQRSLLIDLIRHLYRNLVIVYTMRTKMDDIDFKGYPSEEHFEKLKIPMNNIHLDAFYGNDEQFKSMHVLYLNLRNYNEEIDVAERHILNPELSRETKIEDLDTLEFKVSYLTERIINTIDEIWGLNEGIVQEMKKTIDVSLSGKTNATDNIDVEGSGDFVPLKIEDLKKTAYNKLFSDDELIGVCEIFNNDVKEERKKNNRGVWKVRMIRF